MSEQPIQPTTDPVADPVAPAGVPAEVPAGANKALALLKSRKFWAALIGLALIILKGYRPDFPLTGDQLTGIVVVLVGYIMGTAVEDSAHPTSS